MEVLNSVPQPGVVGFWGGEFPIYPVYFHLRAGSVVDCFLSNESVHHVDQRVGRVPLQVGGDLFLRNPVIARFVVVVQDSHDSLLGPARFPAGVVFVREAVLHHPVLDELFELFFRWERRRDPSHLDFLL